MTTPRDPNRPIRGSLPGDDRPPHGDRSTPEDRWTPEDRYPVERYPPRRVPLEAVRRDDDDPWEPQARRRRPLWASAGLAALLAAVLVGLILLAVVLPGLGGPAPSASTAASPSPSLIAETASPTPTPSPTPEPSPTPLPSVLEVTVEPGDTLTSIAEAYDTKARSVAFWNRDRYPNLDPQSEDYDPDTIQVGWKLIVHPGQTFPEPSPAASASAAPSAAASDGVASAAPGR